MDQERSQVELLISLLVRFPKLATVHYEPDEKVLRMVFLLKDAHQDFHDFAHVFESHLSLFHNLRQEDVLVAALKKTENPVLTIIEINRDLASLSLSELNLTMELINDYYGDTVVQEGPEVGDDDEHEQNAIIESLLTSIPWRGLERLTGFRENGRVLVFSTPPTGVIKS